MNKQRTEIEQRQQVLKGNLEKIEFEIDYDHFK